MCGCAKLAGMNKWVFPILTQLADGKFHSGEALARELNVTRATVFNGIQAAQAMGVSVFSVHGRGYRLPQAVTLLNHADIVSAVGASQGVFHLEVLPEVDSTNTHLMRASAQGAPHLSVAVAELQTQGKGRRGRVWVSQLGASLTFSLLWRFQCGAAALSGLSLAVGVALVRGLTRMGVPDVQLKWPNDVLIQGKKLAGILIELQGDMEGPSAAVIGVGINMQLSAETKSQIDQPVVDVLTVCGQAVNPNALLGVLLVEMHKAIQLFEQQGFAALKAEWTDWHAYQAQAVRMLMPNGNVIEGVVQDVAEDGVLLVQTADGLKPFNAGEISLRGAA